MNKLDELYDMLAEQLYLYEDFMQIEEEKYNVILMDDISRLDEIVVEEQVFFLKSRGLDQNRENLLKELGMTGKTLKQVIECVDDQNKDRFFDMHKNILSILYAFKEKNNQCQDLVQIRLQRAHAMIKKLGESNVNSNGYFKEGKTDEVDINKTKFVSKKI